ncbi:ATP-binding protein [Streptomyces sp. M10(2022)]
MPPIDGTLRGHAVADVIHLLAELVENATVFSAPHTQVLLRVQHVTAGLALEVEDRGLGMPGNEQKRMNALLADPDQVNVAHLLQDGRIGLFVVSALARRHGIAVRLQSNIYGACKQYSYCHWPFSASTPTPQCRPTKLRCRRRALCTGRPAGRRPAGPGAAGPAAAGRAAAAAPAATAVTAPGRGPPLPLPTERAGRPEQPAAQATARVTEETGEAGDGQRAAARAAPAPQAQQPGAPGPSAEGNPVARTGDANAVHDPGLMAAFRRGIDLAEAQVAEDTGPTPRTTRCGTARWTPARRGCGHRGGAGTWPCPLPVRGVTTARPQPDQPQPGFFDAHPSESDPRAENTYKE